MRARHAAMLGNPTPTKHLALFLNFLAATTVIRAEIFEQVLVKVNANVHERAWLPAIGREDPDIVPEVFGSGDSIDDVPDDG